MKIQYFKKRNSIFYSMVLTTLLFTFSHSFSKNTIINPQKIPSNKIYCNTVNAILKAMKNASPGDEIIIAPGTYIALEKTDLPNNDGRTSRFYSNANGTALKPIIIRGQSTSNKPVLQGPNNTLEAYVMRILGDHWIIKNLILKQGSKGLMFDHANHCLVENVTVYNVGDEAIHFRDGSSNNRIKNCHIHHTGLTSAGFGEGIYVGSDRNQHDTYLRDCNHNTIDGCNFGPHITAEAIDVKEGTQHTIIKNCTFSAQGISGANSADAFIDLKGAYGFVYNNIFNVDGSEILASGIDIQDRKTDYNTGFRNAIFNNTFNLGRQANKVMTVRKKEGKPTEIHVWDNKRVPTSSDFPTDNGTQKIISKYCPNWNIVSCELTLESPNCYDTPSTTALPSLDKKSFSTVHVLGNNVPDITNFRRFRIDWDLTQNKLKQFAVNTKNGNPSYYIDLRNHMRFNFNIPQPEMTLTNSGLPKWDGSYWVIQKNGHFIMISKTQHFALFFSNSSTPPNCNQTSKVLNLSQQTEVVELYPNPTKQNIIHLKQLPSKPLVVNLYNLEGKLLKQQKVNASNEVAIELTGIPKGNYILILKGDNYLNTLSWVKQ